jgi:phage terminase large subunit GpA-like protein
MSRQPPKIDGAILALALSRAMRPRPTLTVSQWADRHRILSPKAAAEPGRWRTTRNPALR